MDTAALARQLAELDKVATPGPWYGEKPVVRNEAGRMVADCRSTLMGDVEPEVDYANASLCAALRNNLHAILRALCVMAAVNNIRAESIAPFDYDDVQERADELLADLTGVKP